MIRSWLSALFSLIFPRVCAVCGTGINEGETIICTTCRWDMPLTDYWSVCDNFVVERLAARFPFVQASALMFFKHDSQYRRLIHRMKYGSRPDIGFMLGEIYGSLLSKSALYKDVEVVVPVPLHYSKLMRRGYNQSEQFARGIAHAMGIDLEIGSLRRIRRTRTQAHLRGNDERALNVHGAFAVTKSSKLEGRHILLVDDVLTTGSTLEACALSIVNSHQSVHLYVGAIAVVR